jgi:hypothetical protein
MNIQCIFNVCTISDPEYPNISVHEYIDSQYPNMNIQCMYYIHET